MRSKPPITRVDGTAPPWQVARAWPDRRPLVMLDSGRAPGRWARWSILAEPVAWYRFDGRSRWIGPPPPLAGEIQFSHDPLADLDALLGHTRHRSAAGGPVFAGGWIGYLSYDLGRVIEPSAGGGDAGADRGWPLVELAYCPAALVFDRTGPTWHAVGSPPVRNLQDIGPAPRETAVPPHRRGPPAGLASTLPEPAYRRAVSRVLRYIRAGDAFQVNLTQRLSTTWSGSTRDLLQAALRRGAARYGSYLELPEDRRLLSLSPELFLQVGGDGRSVVTRPIKGTLPGHLPPRRLRASAKDAAELHMIVDLMRNDLGRVCRFGSVRVRAARSIETHPTVHHGVAEVAGRLRREVTVGQLLAATFPPGSVTGAPKIRAMQIIDELEPVRRGPYCGAIGYFSDGGRMALSVAIRTLLLEGRSLSPHRWSGVLDYGAGGAVVADSRPGAEYRESMDKAEILWEVMGGESTKHKAQSTKKKARSTQ